MLKNIKQLFSRNKKRKLQDEDSSKSKSVHNLVEGVQPNSSQNEESETEADAKLSLSHDSIFSPLSNLELQPAKSMGSLAGPGFAEELSSKLRVRPPQPVMRKKTPKVKIDEDAENEDESSAPNDQDFFKENWSHVVNKGQTGGVTSPVDKPKVSINLDCITRDQTALNVSAAKQKIAVRPKKNIRSSALVTRRYRHSPKFGDSNTIEEELSHSEEEMLASADSTDSMGGGGSSRTDSPISPVFKKDPPSQASPHTPPTSEFFSSTVPNQPSPHQSPTVMKKPVPAVKVKPRGSGSKSPHNSPTAELLKKLARTPDSDSEPPSPSWLKPVEQRESGASDSSHHVDVHTLDVKKEKHRIPLTSVELSQPTVTLASAPPITFNDYDNVILPSRGVERTMVQSGSAVVVKTAPTMPAPAATVGMTVEKSESGLKRHYENVISNTASGKPEHLVDVPAVSAVKKHFSSDSKDETPKDVPDFSKTVLKKVDDRPDVSVSNAPRDEQPVVLRIKSPNHDDESKRKTMPSNLLKGVNSAQEKRASLIEKDTETKTEKKEEEGSTDGNEISAILHNFQRKASEKKLTHTRGDRGSTDDKTVANPMGADASKTESNQLLHSSRSDLSSTPVVGKITADTTAAKTSTASTTGKSAVETTTYKQAGGGSTSNKTATEPVPGRGAAMFNTGKGTSEALKTASNKSNESSVAKVTFNKGPSGSTAIIADDKQLSMNKTTEISVAKITFNKGPTGSMATIADDKQISSNKTTETSVAKVTFNKVPMGNTVTFAHDKPSANKTTETSVSKFMLNKGQAGTTLDDKTSTVKTIETSSSVAKVVVSKGPTSAALTEDRPTAPWIKPGVSSGSPKLSTHSSMRVTQVTKPLEKTQLYRQQSSGAAPSDTGTTATETSKVESIQLKSDIQEHISVHPPKKLAFEKTSATDKPPKSPVKKTNDTGEVKVTGVKTKEASQPEKETVVVASSESDKKEEGKEQITTVRRDKVPSNQPPWIALAKRKTNNWSEQQAHLATPDSPPS